MLRQIRSSDKMKKILWTGLLIIIIPSFISFYAGGGSSPSGSSVQDLATIKYPDGTNGKVTRTEYMMARGFLQQNIAQAAQADSKMLDQQAVSDISTEKNVLDQAINLDILRHYAEKNGLVASADEVVAQIQANSTAEQRSAMQQQLASRGVSLDSWIEEQRVQATIEKAVKSIGAKAQVTHYEVWQEYVKDNEQLVLDYVKVNPADFVSSVTVTDEGLKAYYEANKEKFRVPDQVQYDYVITRKDDLKSSITVTDDEITSYYATNQEDFRLPRKVTAKQIFLKLPAREEMNTTSAEAFTSITEAVRVKADEIYERAAKGEDFAALADTFNEEDNYPPRADEGTTATDTQTTAGGSIGTVSEDVVKTWYGDEWTSAVFALEGGGITRPVLTPNGYAITQVEKIIAGELQPLDQVRAIVENRIKDNEVEPVFMAVGQKIEGAIEGATGLGQIAALTSGTVATSPKVNKTDKFIPGIGMLGDFEEAITSLEKGGHSDLLSDSQRHLVVQITQEFPSHVPELDGIRARVETAYKQHLGEEAAKAKADELLKKSTDFAAFSTAVQDMGSTFTRSRPFKRPEVAGIFGGMVRNFANESQLVKKGQTRLSEVGAPGQQQSFVVWHVDQVTEPSKADFAKELPTISERIKNEKQRILMLEFIRDQRSKLADRITVDERLQ